MVFYLQASSNQKSAVKRTTTAKMAAGIQS
jgi:hypothetical protein